MKMKDIEKLYYVPQNTEYVSRIDTFKAMTFAMRVHGNQKRKYTQCPYFLHLAEVAGLISTISNDNMSIDVAWLHDCMEDCGVIFDILVDRFGIGVAYGVQILSDMEKGNRETRKRLSRERLAEAPKWIQDIKICDLISNTSSIVLHDPKFAKTYLEEKRLLLEVLSKADRKLVEMAMNLCDSREYKHD
jgi:(p)ppGpp synthase/HD superfamily hydrolase